MTNGWGAAVAALGRFFIWGKEVLSVKKRKNLGCMIKGTKERGAWAELYFMVLAMSRGLRVSNPYGGFAPYDVGVESTGAILRVQVKCTMYEYQEGSYSMSINVKDGSTGRRRGYARGTVDFFAVYIIPTDDWYILPYEVIGDRDANVFFRPGCKRQKYEKYREAWHLLLEACRAQPVGRLTFTLAATTQPRKLFTTEAQRRGEKQKGNGSDGDSLCVSVVRILLLRAVTAEERSNLCGRGLAGLS